MKVKHLFLILLIFLELYGLYYLIEIGKNTACNEYPLYELILSIYVLQVIILLLLLLIAVVYFLKKNWNKTILNIKRYEN